MAQEKLSYIKHDYKTSLAVVKEWKLYEGDQGCTPIKRDDVCLRINKAPPPLPSTQSESKALPTIANSNAGPVPKAGSAAVPAGPKPERNGPMIALLKWAASDPPVKEQKTELKKEQPIPPFDLRDVPKAMEAMGWKIAARLSQRWLDGRAYDAYPDGAADERHYYDKDMIDTGLIKLSWLLGQNGVKTKYENLIAKSIFSENASLALRKKFAYFFASDRWFRGDLDTLQSCGGDVQKLHRLFQFQFEYVSTIDGLSISEWQRKGMTEITAALGSFNFYAAVGRAKVTLRQYKRYNTPDGELICTHSTVEITHAYVYARDSYSFRDVKGKASQYLGHWNKTGVIGLLDAFAAGTALNREIESEPYYRSPVFNADASYTSPVDTGKKLREQDIFYPVRNRDYQHYRAAHQRGGDFAIYSDLRLIKLDQPILLDMGEICR